MSIINEALRKAARERQSKSVVYPHRTVPPIISRRPFRRRWLYGPAAALLVVALVVIFGWKRGGLSPEPTRRAPALVPPPTAPSPEEKAREPRPPEPSRTEVRPDRQRGSSPDGTLFNARAVKAFQGGDVKEARRLLEEALRISPGLAEAHNNLGMIHKLEGRVEQARREYLCALQIRPEYPEALNNFGVLLQGEGNAAGAREYFRKAVDADPGYSSAHLNLAISYERDGIKAEALYHYRRFLDTAGPEQADLVRKIKGRLRG